MSILDRRKSGLYVQAKFMEKAEFDRILRDMGVRSARARDAFWGQSQGRQPLTEEVVRRAARKTLERAPDLRWRTF